MTHKIFEMPFSIVYPLYVKKVERKGQTEADLLTVISWLTGYSNKELLKLAQDQTTFREFFDKARLNPNASLITGVICGMRVENIEDPLMQKIRYMDKIVDELANGKKLEKILRA
jgi:hypothetical protein